MQEKIRIIGLGSNLPSHFGTPLETLERAVEVLVQCEVLPIKLSRIWKTAPVPFTPDHPWYYNAVAIVETNKSAEALLETMLAIELQFGRVRSVPNAPRVLDLDLIAYDNEIIIDEPEIIVPHPRMAERAFVLLPMADIISEWVHPITGRTLDDLVNNLPKEQEAFPVGENYFLNKVIGL